MSESLQIMPMQPEHQEEVIKLISKAMNDDEATWARQTFDFYFSCQQQQIDSKRQFFIGLDSSPIAGIVGLHEYRWGPSENVWLSWFAVHPKFQQQGYGQELLIKGQNLAREQGYRKMFIETYQHPDFDKALRFYQRNDFEITGEIQAYLADGSNMLILSRSLV